MSRNRAASRGQFLVCLGSVLKIVERERYMLHQREEVEAYV